MKTAHGAVAFRRLHEADAGFVMPNAWDEGSAIVLAAAGFPAIGSTSAGIAFSLGRPDHGAQLARVERQAMFDRMCALAQVVSVPVNADLEDGYGARPEDVAECVRRAIEAGFAGGNIEDWSGGALYDESLAVERIVAAKEARFASGSDFVLTARTDGQLLESPVGLPESIARAQRFVEAGADCIFVPGLNDLGALRTVASEVSAPVNAVLGLGSSALTVETMFEAGVQRVSLGGTFARAAFGLIAAGAKELAERGTIGFAEGQLTHGQLNEIFIQEENC